MKVVAPFLASARIRPQHPSHLHIWRKCPKQPCAIRTRAAQFWTRTRVAEQFVEIQGTKIPVQETLTSPFHKLQIAARTERAEPLPCPALTTVLSIWSINNWRETSAAAGGRFCAQLSSSCFTMQSMCWPPFPRSQADKEGKKNNQPKPKRSQSAQDGLPSPEQPICVTQGPPAVGLFRQMQGRRTGRAGPLDLLQSHPAPDTLFWALSLCPVWKARDQLCPLKWAK